MIVCANPKAQYKSYKSEIDEAISKVLEGDKYILGDEVEAFETEFADFNRSKYCIGVGNGTDAIEISLRALDIGPGDEVITVSHTAVATISAIERVGASPVLVDIDYNYFSLDTNYLEGSLTSKTKAIVLVHLYGQAGDIVHVEEFCKKNDLYLIEDVAQAHGAFYKEKRLGSFGKVGCFSCYPTKNLGAIGDGGLITTDDKSLYEEMLKVREYGWVKRNSVIKGINSRLDEIQAAILRVKLKYLDNDNSRRNEIAKIYNSINLEEVLTPLTRPDSTHVYHQYVCKVQKRDELMEYLSSNDIFAGIHYPFPVHEQPAYKKLVKPHSLEVTEKVCKEIISLPMYPELPKESAFLVKEIIEEFY